MSLRARLAKLEKDRAEREAAERAVSLAGVAELVAWGEAESAEYRALLIDKTTQRLGPQLSAALQRVRTQRPGAIALGVAIVREVEAAGEHGWRGRSSDELMAGIAALCNSQDWCSGAAAAVLYACHGQTEPTAQMLAEALTPAERAAVETILSPDVSADMEQEQIVWAAIARLPQLVDATRRLMAERGLTFAWGEGQPFTLTAGASELLAVAAAPEPEPGPEPLGMRAMGETQAPLGARPLDYRQGLEQIAPVAGDMVVDGNTASVELPVMDAPQFWPAIEPEPEAVPDPPQPEPEPLAPAVVERLAGLEALPGYQKHVDELSPKVGGRPQPAQREGVTTVDLAELRRRALQRVLSEDW